MPVDISDLEAELMPCGKLKPMPHEYFRQFELNKLLYFMHQRALYILPTTELIDWLKENIVGRAIEICAGNGSLGRSLGIPITDSKQQERPEMIAYYRLVGQPPITYPNDVEKFEANDAVVKYRPDTVVGSYVTHRYDAASNSGNVAGPNEGLMLSSIKRYIMVGNLVTHASKPLLKKRHAQYKFPWLICRAQDQEQNRIFVWDNPPTL